MPNVSRFSGPLGRLLDEFGDAAASAIREVQQRLGAKATAETVRAELKKQGFRPIRGLSDNPASRAIEQASAQPKNKSLAAKTTTAPKPRTAKQQHDIEVFHGTTREFETLDPSRAKAGLGVYATPNRDFAAEFARGEGRVLSGRLRPDDVVDLSEFGAFPDASDLGEIAARIGANPDDLAKVYRDLSRQQGDVHMFSLLENAGVEIPERAAWKFEDWGQGSPEPAYVFADPALFAVNRPEPPSLAARDVDAPRRSPTMEDLAVKPGRKGFETEFKPPSEEPVATQAGRLGVRLGGPEQTAVAHPSPYGAFSSVKPRAAADETSSDFTIAREFGPEPRGRNRPLGVFDPDAPREQFPLEALENKFVVSLLGDRSAAGRRIRDIDGTPVNVMTYGGPRYGEFNQAMGSDAVWASEQGPITALQKQIRGGLDQGLDVVGIHTAMGPQSIDQTTMVADALLQQIRGGDSRKRDINSLNKEIRKFIPDFVGVQDPAAYRQLADQTQGTRLEFVRAIDNSKRLAQGFPDVSATRIALTEPELRNVPAGASGFSVVKLGPESVSNLDPTFVHPTYPVQIAGTPAGQLEELVPFDMLFSDMVNQRRAAGASASRDLRALELSKPAQRVSSEQLERLLDFAVRARRGD
jgi:hypothetical protein